MARDTEQDRISRKAHELWESEGRPHGRDQIHWDEAKEIVALEDSMDETLLPRETGATEPEEPELAVTSQGDVPNLTDQGADDLTSTDREPAVTKPKGRSIAKPAAVSPTPVKESASVKSATSAKAASAADATTTADPSPVGDAPPVSVTGKAMPKSSSKPGPVTKGKSGGKR